jgi:hypothetical protein
VNPGLKTILNLPFETNFPNTLTLSRGSCPDTLVPKMIYICGHEGRDKREWVVGSTRPACHEWEWAQDRLDEAREHQMSEVFRQGYALCQDALMKPEEKHMPREQSPEQSRDEFRNAKHQARLRTKTDFQFTEGFTGRTMCKSLSYDRSLTMQPNCYRCQCLHRFQEMQRFPAAVLKQHMVGYDWGRKKGRPHACAEAMAAYECAHMEAKCGQEPWR